MKRKVKVVSDKDPLLKAISNNKPVFYFDNKSDYNEFIKDLFGETPDWRTGYSYKGMRIVYYEKNISDLLTNDYYFKQMR